MDSILSSDDNMLYGLHIESNIQYFCNKLDDTSKAEDEILKRRKYNFMNLWEKKNNI